jgi:hypothetical protein
MTASMAQPYDGNVWQTSLYISCYVWPSRERPGSAYLVGCTITVHGDAHVALLLVLVGECDASAQGDLWWAGTGYVNMQNTSTTCAQLKNTRGQAEMGPLQLKGICVVCMNGAG